MKSSRVERVAVLPLAFRDTALTIALLGQGASANNFDTFRRRCNDQVGRLREELVSSGQPSDVVEDAIYAQCALFDEAALGSLQGDDRDAWEREPMQVMQFNTHHAGEELIERMHRRLADPQAAKPLLAIFLATLSLGFKGRFARDEEGARLALIRTLRERLGMPEHAVDSIIVQSGKRRLRFAYLSPFFILAFAIAATSAVYLLLDRWLTDLAAQVLH